MSEFLERLSDAEIVGLTIIGEARGEPIEGQVAVGSVIRNRLHHSPAKYKKYYDVCLEPLQFSCWNKYDPNYQTLMELAVKLLDGTPLVDIHLRQCMLIARGIVSWDIKDNTRGARNYMTTELYQSETRPSWAKDATNVRVYGNQTFMNV